MMTGTSGRMSWRQFSVWEHGCWWERTSQGTFPWGSTKFSGTWPKRGSMRSGWCFEHPTWVPATSGRGSGSLLPTPTSSQPGGTAEQHLARKNRMPDGAKRTSVTDLRMRIERDVLHEVVLLPTPVVNDMGEGKSLEWWDERTAGMQAKHGNGNGHGRSLAVEAMRLLPTPATQDGENNGGASQRKRNTPPLNTVVAWIGASTPRPSTDGKPSSDDPRLPLPTKLDG